LFERRIDTPQGYLTKIPLGGMVQIDWREMHAKSHER
jgi:hypothetical protein